MITNNKRNGETEKSGITELQKIYENWSDYSAKMRERLSGEPEKVIKELKEEFDLLKELQNNKDRAESDAVKRLWELKENLNNIIASLEEDDSKEAIKLKEELHNTNNGLKLINTTGVEPTDVKPLKLLYDKYSGEQSEKIKLKLELMNEQVQELKKAEDKALKAGKQIKMKLTKINELVSIVKEKNKNKLYILGNDREKLQNFINKVEKYIKSYSTLCHEQEVTNRLRVLTELFRKKIRSLDKKLPHAIWSERARGEKNTIKPELEENKEYLASVNNALMIYKEKVSGTLRDYQIEGNVGTKEILNWRNASGKEKGLAYEGKNYGNKRLPLAEYLKLAKTEGQSLNPASEIASGAMSTRIAVNTLSEPNRS